jgi:hypothetical protein
VPENVLMTLEQTTRLILSGAELHDLGALEAAAKERGTAMAALDAMPATEEMRGAIAASLQAGEEAKRTIQLIRQRIRNESRRLERIETGFVRALWPTTAHRIDCKG